MMVDDDILDYQLCTGFHTLQPSSFGQPREMTKALIGSLFREHGVIMDTPRDSYQTIIDNKLAGNSLLSLLKLSDLSFFSI